MPQKRPQGAHAAHSPRHAQDLARTSTPPTSLGIPYPRDDVVAVIDDRESAEQAVEALRHTGLPDDDVDLLDGRFVVETSRSFEQHRGRLQRLEAWLSSAFSDDAAYARSYVLEAERGHYLVIAHAPRPDVVERVRQVLRAYGAHGMRHYESWTVTDL